MSYVDGFLTPVPKKNLKKYRSIAIRAGKIWIQCGALEYRETLGDDFDLKAATNFPKMAKAKKTEVVVFSWIVYKSRKHRDQVIKKVFADPRIQKMIMDKPVFDFKRMAYGGFKTIVSL
jgi:uncharacterized protein YbaA (DUF1428 family)